MLIRSMDPKIYLFHTFRAGAPRIQQRIFFCSLDADVDVDRGANLLVDPLPPHPTHDQDVRSAVHLSACE